MKPQLKLIKLDFRLKKKSKRELKLRLLLKRPSRNKPSKKKSKGYKLLPKKKDSRPKRLRK